MSTKPTQATTFKRVPSRYQTHLKEAMAQQGLDVKGNPLPEPTPERTPTTGMIFAAAPEDLDYFN